MSGDDEAISRFISYGRIACTVIGILKDGRIGHATGWCSPEEIADPSISSPGVFARITENRPDLRGSIGAQFQNLPDWYFDIIEAKGWKA